MQDQQKTTHNSSDELASVQKAWEKAEDEFHKKRMPLYVIVGVAILIGSLSAAYLGSGEIFIMCLVFGGGTAFYLWVTRNNGPDIPRW